MIKKALTASALLFCFTATLTTPVYAQSTKDVVCQQLDASGEVKCDGGSSAVQDTLTNIVNLLTFIIGAAAVIVIVVAGLMYVLSGGNPQNTARAKDAIIYAVVGLIVAFLARLIVNFVITQFA